MSDKKRLRETRADTVSNETSKRQDEMLREAVQTVKARIENAFPTLTFGWVKKKALRPIIETLRLQFPSVSFCECRDSSFMLPDGGILFLIKRDGTQCPILIAEKKNQGTNDLRAREGKPRQAQGNAIERLGKNVIGFRTWLLGESIFPFVCFGDGCDFAEECSILDRVRTIAMFGTLNTEHLHWEGPYFNRGTFYFRVPEWTRQEMEERCLAIAKKSVYYYLSKYGEEAFQ